MGDREEAGRGLYERSESKREKLDTFTLLLESGFLKMKHINKQRLEKDSPRERHPEGQPKR